MAESGPRDEARGEMMSLTAEVTLFILWFWLILFGVWIISL
jgi:hypothetical protein